MEEQGTKQTEDLKSIINKEFCRKRKLNPEIVSEVKIIEEMGKNLIETKHFIKDI